MLRPHLHSVSVRSAEIAQAFSASRSFSTSASTAYHDVQASQLTVTRTTSPGQLPPSSKLLFGRTFSDHMLRIPWSETTGWGAPSIEPFSPINLTPAATVLHYAQSLFEGMKAYKHKDNTVTMFRPNMNMKRMNNNLIHLSAHRLSIGDALIECIRQLISLERDWIPKEPGHSLYIRPTMIGTNGTLGVQPPTEALLFVICSPAGPYYPQGFKPVALYGTTDSEYIRAAPGGTGAYKLAANYAPGVVAQKTAATAGYAQNLWLHGREHWLTEVGTMNMFVVFKGEDGMTELVTPPLDGMILPVSERPVCMGEIIEASKTGRLVELFGSGTAAVVTPVEKIGYMGSDVVIPTGEDGMGPVSKPLWKELVGIQTAMLYDQVTAQHLKPWLVRTLGPICDAEPTALAEYVLALLKHNLPEAEMRKELTFQLEEFLEKESPSFIDTLFTVLRTKSYLPYTNSPPPSQSSSPNPHPTDAGIPIPLDGLLPNNVSALERGQKRPHLDDDRDSLPAKGPRLTADGQISRYSSGRDARSTGQWGPRNDRGPLNGAGPSMNGQRIQTYQPPDQRRGICRDYHNNGYCARGALCKYSHGDDAFVPSQLFAMGGAGGPMPFLPMFPNGSMPFGMVGPGATYDPHEARMDVRPSGNMMAMNGRAGTPRTPLLSRGQEDGSQPARGELPVIQDLTPEVPEDTTTATSQPPPPQDGTIWTQGTPPAQQPEAMDVDTIASLRPVRVGPAGVRGGGRGGGRGTFSGDAQSFRPERRNDKTLAGLNASARLQTSQSMPVLPKHWCSGIDRWKVMVKRVRGMLAASAPLVASIATRSAIPTTPSTAIPPTTTSRKPVTTPNAAAELAAKQKLLQEKIAEQKSLMASLATASGEEKKTIMTRLRKLGEEMKSPSPASTHGESSSHSASATQPAASSAEPFTQHDKERERLDKEAGSARQEVRVCVHLDATRVLSVTKAASLGISEGGDYASGGGSSYRPYRGRGRGTRGAYFRGGGRGASRGSMKLDNRPKILLLKGVREDAIPAIREWYETVGSLEAVDSIGDEGVLVSFRTRAAGEQALAKGSNIPSIGAVQISWHSGQQSFPSSQTFAVSSSQPNLKENGMEDAPPLPVQQDHSLSRRQEEEVVASGWGDGDEDDMGF
ncbi:hypothetical protein JVU11DRAFT_5470 [Chiua virens]|nr:hypothetical protein JVU11DRAFT_5470 [Chiua virens]